MTVDEILTELEAHGSERNRRGMARFGINTRRALGVSMVVIRRLGKQIGRNHDLALDLWATEVHEARILASVVADPARVTVQIMDSWVEDFDSWDLCDQVCGNLFDRTPHAWTKAIEWSGRDEEFVKRAGFALMAYLAVHDKKAADESFMQFLPIIEAESDDARNFVTKAISWALRQIGKRNTALHAAAIETATAMIEGSKAAERVARDGLRELESAKVRRRLGL